MYDHSNDRQFNVEWNGIGFIDIVCVCIKKIRAKNET